VDLFKRGEIANKAKADLFVSVHCDSHNSDAHGAGTFVLGLHANKQNFEIAKKENSVIYLEDDYETRYADYDINSPESVIGLTIMQEEFLDQSIQLGKLVQDRFTGKLGRTDRKVKQAGFIVLHQTFMPSVLIETGFLTNKDEGSYLNSRKGQQEMGRAIADAILEYRNSVRAGAGTDVVQTPHEEKKEVPPAASQPDRAATQPAAGNTDKTLAAAEKPAAGVVNKQADPVDAGKEQPAGKEVSQPAKNELPAAAAAVKSEAPAIVFKVQLVAVSKEPSLNPDDFNGLPNLSVEKHQKVYRVLYGNAPSYEEAQRLQSFAALRGYPSAYIVAYRNGERIPLPEALSALSQ
jgi:N-acetylmuramoyl-L-alanine amidase